MCSTVATERPQPGTSWYLYPSPHTCLLLAPLRHTVSKHALQEASTNSQNGDRKQEREVRFLHERSTDYKPFIGVPGNYQL